ncbi:SH3-containing GRB2-like protein 3-interacting protein 1 isoform X2 [Esox lucius]|uniref:SH3-containing GRB2-like protein 3-interacting protein 1 isoform X2 n=1 Tax=Esox lucius TaxID=8010 RepID=UPI00097332A4|nr:SH3-containing GRB2-like protein 3-interacting protein 1 isoform X2 [Esox lucius]
MMEGLKKRTRKAFGLRKKEKDTDSTGSPDRDGGSTRKKKTNGAPNGYYGEIDWERYVAPDVDAEGFSLRPGEEGETAPRGKQHFFSSDSEDEDDKRRFKIKIKPLPSDTAKCAVPSVDELKASVGGLALSPSLRRSPRRSPGSMKRHLSYEEIARPRRSTPTPSPAPEMQSERGSQNRRASPAFFGPPPESTNEIYRYDSNRNDVVCLEADAWAVSTFPDSPLARGFPTGAPPPVPPKNISASSQADIPNGRIVPVPAPIYLNIQSPASYRGSPVPDLDDVFGPMESSRTNEDRASPRWVSFNSERPPPPDEPAPPPPPASPPPDSPLSSPPDSPCLSPDSPCLSPGPPPDEPPPSPPPFSSPPDSPISIISIPPPDEPVPPLPPDFLPPDTPLCVAVDPSLFLDDEMLEYSSSAPPLGYPCAPPSPAPPPLPAERTSRAGVPSPLVFLREGQQDFVASPLGVTPGFRSPPPPLPPLTYRSIVSSPGPGSGSSPSSPARPATPLSGGSPIPPPPPPRPSSRPKLPPGKPIGDLTRPFSPPVSGSPPPFAPLARAESSSSISSVTSLSAASTPTLGRELSISTAGCSRGPSPLTMGAQDTLPVAAAFTETINAYFKGADPSKCVVKITGEMVLSFPAGITRHFASHPSAPVLTFSISNYSRLEQVLPNPQLLCCDTTTSNVDTKEFWVNMPNLMCHLRRVADQKPQATYYNVDMIKYQVAAEGIQSTPLNLAVSWRGDANSTDLRIDYKYNTEAMAAPSPLHNIHFLVSVDGGVARVQNMIPTAHWNPEQQKILWKIQNLSQRSENGGVGALLGRFQLTEGPSRPSQLAVQFTSEGSTLSGCDIQLVRSGYRLSLVKKRFAAGKYLADN